MKPTPALGLPADGPRPHESKFERKQKAILHAAAALFNLHGVGRVTLADVAGEVGLNLKSLRYYFIRKEDLVAAAFLDSIAVHCRLIEDAEQASDSVRGRLIAFITSYFDLHRAVRLGEKPPFLHFGDIRALIEPHSLMVWPAYNDMFRRMRRILRAREASGDGRLLLNVRAHTVISQILWSVVWLSDYGVNDLDRARDRFTDILLNGIGERPAWRPRVLPPPEEPGDGDRLSKASFLKAATATLNAYGYRGASAEMISAELKVTKGSFYYHNETQDALIVACFERTFTLMEYAQDAARTPESTGYDQAVSASAALIEWHVGDQAPLLRTSALTVVDIEVRERLVRMQDQITDRFANMLIDGSIDGSVRRCDPRVAAQMITALINSSEELRRWVPQATSNTAAELYGRPLFEGLFHPTERADRT